MNSLRVALSCTAILSASLRAQITDTESGVTAGIPVNYTEAKTGSYTLPDPLKFADGSPVAGAKAWFERRRPELMKLIEEDQYGRVPGRPAAMSFDVFDKAAPTSGPAPTANSSPRKLRHPSSRSSGKKASRSTRSPPPASR